MPWADLARMCTLYKLSLPIRQTTLVGLMGAILTADPALRFVCCNYSISCRECVFWADGCTRFFNPAPMRACSKFVARADALVLRVKQGEVVR